MSRHFIHITGGHPGEKSRLYRLMQAAQSQQHGSLGGRLQSGPSPSSQQLTMNPIYARYDSLISSLTDSTKRDDIKYKDLRDINDSFDELTSNQCYLPLIDSLIRAFIGVLRETQPQFISENNTLQLRKLVLELMLRLSTSDSMKNYTKTVQALLLRICISENEENTLIALKIIGDQIKTFRAHFCSELLEFYEHWRNAYQDMLQYASQDRMILSPDFFEANTRSIEDFAVLGALESCFITTVLSFKHVQPPNLKYSLIPRAKQSVRVLAEMSTFLLITTQTHCKQQQQQQQAHQLVDLFRSMIPLFIRYAEIVVPMHIRNEKSYNKELVDEFQNSQIRTLTCVAYAARQPQYAGMNFVEENTKAIINAIKQLFDGLHGDVIHQRRDLLVMLKYFIQTPFNMRDHLAEVIPRLLSDSVIMGTSFTARDQLKNHSYTLMADIFHHCRMNLSFKILTHIVFFAIRNYHDNFLLPHVQTMFGKLMMNYVEPLLTSEKQDENEQKQAYDILICAFEAHVRKTIFLSEYHLPVIRERIRVGGAVNALSTTVAKTVQKPVALAGTTDESTFSTSTPATAAASNSEAQPADNQSASTVDSLKTLARDESSKQPGAGDATNDPAAPTKKMIDHSDVVHFSINDFRNMMKFTFTPIKLIIAKRREVYPSVASKKETDLLSQFFIYGLKCMDVYTFAVNPMNPYQKAAIRSKEEKEIADTFIAVFSCLDQSLFCSIIEEHIEFFVDRVSQSPILQSICSALLVHHSAGPHIGAVLIKYLLNHLPEMGASLDNAVHFLKLFKLAFSAVSYSQANAECGNMLTPYVSDIVQDSMRLAMISRESLNYFWLLRALFRSIGSGAHDRLYQQFLPQLPSILQQLNRLQNNAHVQSTHELFAELCLTVPVRLSSLLPYLPLLMDPLVCSLHGSASLIQQGLRTLELCVDNLQPEYFYDHMFPVRAPLLQGLWRTVSSPDQQTALAAFRIIGKFGGSTRKVLLDARYIDFKSTQPEHVGNSPVFEISSQRQRRVKLETNREENDGDRTVPVPFNCELPLQAIVEGATSILKSWKNSIPREPTTTHNTLGVASMGYASNEANAPRLQALEIVKMVLLTALRSTKLFHLSDEQLKQTFLCALQRSRDHMASNVQRHRELFDTPATLEFVKSRRLYSTALVGLFYAVVNNDLQPLCHSFYKAISRYFTMQSVLQFGCGEDFDENSSSSLNMIVLVDAIKVASAEKVKDFTHPVVAATKFMVDTARAAFGEETACDFPFFDYLLRELTLLCHRNEWYARLGGCTALAYMIRAYPLSFIRRNASIFLSVTTEITARVAEEVSFGTLDHAENTSDVLLTKCFPQSDSDDGAVDESMICIFVSHVIERLNDAEVVVRKEALRILDTIVKRTKQTMAHLIQRFDARAKEILFDSVDNFTKLSMESQIGVLEMFSLLAELPDLRWDWASLTSEEFLQNLIVICNTSQEQFIAQFLSSGGETSVSKPPIKFAPLRIAATSIFQALTAWYLQSVKGGVTSNSLIKKVFSLLLTNALHYLKEDNKLCEHSRNAVEKIVKHNNSSYACQDLIAERIEIVFADANETFSLEQMRQLAFLIKSTTKTLSKENITMLQSSAKKILSMAFSDVDSSHVECMLIFIELFLRLSQQDIDFFKASLAFVAQNEQKSRTPAGLPYFEKEPWSGVVARFASANAVYGGAEFFIHEANSDDTSSLKLSEICIKILEHEDGIGLKKALMGKSSEFIKVLQALIEEPLFANFDSKHSNFAVLPNMSRMQRLLKIAWKLVEGDEQWFATADGVALFDMARRLWTEDRFRKVFGIRREYNKLDNIENYAELMTSEKYDVPVYCVHILLLRLRYLLSGKSDESFSNRDLEIIDIVYDLCDVFSHDYISDFTFVRAFIDNEIISSVSLEWRRKALKKVIDELKTLEANRRSTGVVKICNDKSVRFMQFIVMPSFYMAFENNNVDDVVGNSPDAVDDNDSLMAIIISYIETICSTGREGSSNSGKTTRDNVHCMSDSMMIVMYQFCVLLVQNCPLHIHDTSKKIVKSTSTDNKQQESNRLRSFMLFGWPTLQANFLRDLTEKYAGHFLIANIIDRFAINRKIVLQVLNSLVTAHHQDQKEMVRRALDILVPAVPRRMDDGHFQLYTMIKKAILDENRSVSQIALHCLNIVIRHHKVFYVVRHQMSHLILNTLQRIVGVQFGFEARRLVVDVCDMFIKWEQERQRIIGLNEAATIPRTSSSGALRTSASQSSIADSTDGIHACVEPSISSNSNSPGVVDAESKNTTTDDLQRSLDKSVVDEVIFLLVRTANAATEVPSSPGYEQICRRSILLLRIAMKPNIFGNIATIRSQWFDKQLLVPSHEQISSEQSLSHHFSQIQVTLDFFANTIAYLPQPVVINLFRPLQHKLIDCLSCSSSHVVRAAYTVVSRLMEKCNPSSQGMPELETLNQFVVKYIHDNFSAYYNSLIASIQPILMAITLLRNIHNVQPAYIETMCLNPFLKMLQRLVRDYQMPTASNQSSKASEATLKLFSDALVICLDTLSPRTKHLSFEAKRTIAQGILIPLIDKGAVDKVLEALIKFVHELVIDDGEFRSPSNAQTGEIINLGIGLLIRMCSSLETRITANAELFRLFLESVLFVHESGRFHQHSDITSRLNVAYFWGLSCNDHNIRLRCFKEWEKYFPRDPFHRLIYILTKQNWQAFGNYFWIPHVAHLLLLCNGPVDQHASYALKKCKVFSEITERIIDHVQQEAEMKTEISTTDVSAEPKLDTDVKVKESLSQDTSTSMAEGDAATAGENKTLEHQITDDVEMENSEISYSQQPDNKTVGFDCTELLEVFDAFNSMLKSAMSQQLDAFIENVSIYLHYDWRVAKIVFLELFCSIWRQLDSEEREEIQRYAQPFLSSMSMTPQTNAQISAAAVFLEAFSVCDPPIQFTPPLLSYIGMEHNHWHFVISLLENEMVNIRLSREVLQDIFHQPTEQLEVMDNLALLYTRLNEPDQLWMVWKRRYYYRNTIRALHLYNQGDFLLSKDLFSNAMRLVQERIEQKWNNPENSPITISPAIHAEIQFIEKYWINSCKELGDWNSLSNLANNADVANAGMLMEAAWHLDQPRAVAECARQADLSGDSQLYVKTALYKTMLMVKTCDPKHKDTVDQSLTDLSRFMIREWQKLPSIVSTSHIDLLVDAHILHEVQEANSTLLTSNTNNNTNTSVSNNNNIKHVMKSWRSRSLTQVDSLSAWSKIFTWRIQHYRNIWERTQSDHQKPFIVHSFSQSVIAWARSLRRSEQIEAAMDKLNSLNTVTAVLPADGQMDIVESTKCFIALASGIGDPLKKLSKSPTDFLCYAYQKLHGTQLHPKDQARLQAVKGTVLSRLDKRDRACTLFAEAVSEKASTSNAGNMLILWKNWGYHVEKLFLSNPVDANALNFGVQALVCFLESAKLTSATKSRPHISRIFWLIKMIASVGNAQCLKGMEDALSAHVLTIPSVNWLFWLDEIVADVRQRSSAVVPSKAMIDLLCHMAESYPQQVFYVLRLALGPAETDRQIAQLSRNISTFAKWSACVSRKETTRTTMTTSNVEVTNSSADDTPAATDWREHCLRAVDALYLRQPVNIWHLNQLLHELDNVNSSLLETLLYKLRELVNVCNDLEFENLADLAEMRLRKDVMQKTDQLNKYLDECLGTMNGTVDRSLCKLLTAIRDEIAQILEGDTKSLQQFASCVRRALAVVVQTLRFDSENRQFFMRDMSSVLNRFKSKMALVDMFNGHIHVRISHFYSEDTKEMSFCQVGTAQTVQIANFPSTYYVFSRQNGVRRLLQVRALNGKIYSYFLERTDTNPSANYIVQLFTMLNTQFAKDRGMCQRLMQLAVPRSLMIGERCRLVECCPISGSAHHFRITPTDSTDSLDALAFHSFLDIFDRMFRHYRKGQDSSIANSNNDGGQLEWPTDSWSGSLEVVDYFYRRLTEQRYSHKALVEIFSGISGPVYSYPTSTQSMSNQLHVPRDLWKRWMQAKYPDSTSYWIVRRNLAIGFALLGMIEYGFFLSPLLLSGFYIDLSTSQLFYGDYRFDLSKKVGEKAGSKVSIVELDGNRSVNIRLSTNIAHFLEPSIEGHMRGALLATGKCLDKMNIERTLRPLLWDVFYEALCNNGRRAGTNADGSEPAAAITLREVVSPVEHALDVILGRIRNYARDMEAQLESSCHSDNLCRMDPNWHPWF